MNCIKPCTRTLLLLVGFFSVVALARVHPSLEMLDELNDAEIYKAVVSSVRDWQRKQILKKINGRTKRDEVSKACYENLGCFEASGPFGYLETLPDKPELINTRFLMYPGRSRRRSGSPPAEVPFESLKEAFEWAKQGFNSSLPTKVLIHGFGSDCGYIWIYEMRSALMAVEEANVICVDWEKGALLPNYVKATANTRLVGKQLAMLLKGLVDNNGLSLRNTHLIGFSLGAHIAGFAGAELGNLSRITGLDPAGPLFEAQDPRARLDQNDAAFVDVIHSNGENLIYGGLGTSQPMGHVDFYPNGGKIQKGCSHLFVGAVTDIIWSSAVEGRSLCNHRRAYKFFIDSVSPRCHFPAFPCDSYDDFLAGKCFPCTDQRRCGNMGYYADRSKGRGQLYLITRDEEPFCAHQYHVKIESSPSQTPIKSYGKIQITLIGDSFLNETFMMTRKEDEEMILGESISRILVPHPILSQPTRIQILYTAYSGWLSSGLTQWKVDKVTLMDSFGKTSSVCKKNLVLDSQVPVTLPLYPGECNVPAGDDSFEKEAEDRIHDVEPLPENDTASHKNGFVPTPVIKIGPEDTDKEHHNTATLSLRNAIDIFNIPWQNDKENKVEDDGESSRAFNTRIIKNADAAASGNASREIVEPVLKPHATKNARSHDPDKQDKPEITEPILGPTTSKNFGAFSVDASVKDDFIAKINKQNKELKYNFYDPEDSFEWTPSVNPAKLKEGKFKREESNTRVFGGYTVPPEENPLEVIATTVQFLPQRLARMFEQAEKYARETILPLVSTYTPKFISDFISPKEKPKYMPLVYNEPVQTTTTTRKSNAEQKRSFNPPPKIETSNEITTPYTHIQKIKKKDQNIIPISSVTSTEKIPETTAGGKEVSRRARDDAHVSRDTKKGRKEIYIDLPIFTEADSKYIPLTFSDETKLN